MQVKSTAEALCNTFDLHSTIICPENLFFDLLLSGCLRQVLLYNTHNIFLLNSEDTDRQAVNGKCNYRSVTVRLI